MARKWSYWSSRSHFSEVGCAKTPSVQSNIRVVWLCTHRIETWCSSFALKFGRGILHAEWWNSFPLFTASRVICGTGSVLSMLSSLHPGELPMMSFSPSSIIKPAPDTTQMARVRVVRQHFKDTRTKEFADLVSCEGRDVFSMMVSWSRKAVERLL